MTQSIQNFKRAQEMFEIDKKRHDDRVKKQIEEIEQKKKKSELEAQRRISESAEALPRIGANAVASLDSEGKFVLIQDGDQTHKIVLEQGAEQSFSSSSHSSEVAEDFEMVDLRRHSKLFEKPIVIEGLHEFPEDNK